MRVLRLLGLRRRSRFPETEGLDEEKICSVRETISRDCSKLAEKNLTLSQRKAVRERLDKSVAELQNIAGRKQDAKPRKKLRRPSEAEQ
jgi:hypothetical protein